MTTTGPAQRLVIRSADDIEERNVHNVRIRPIMGGPDAGFESSFAFVLYNRLPVGEVNEMHVHDDVEKVYYIIEGEAEVMCGPWTGSAKAGDFIFLPAAIHHQIRSLGPAELAFTVCAARTLDTPRGLGGDR